MFLPSRTVRAAARVHRRSNAETDLNDVYAFSCQVRAEDNISIDEKHIVMLLLF